MKTFFTAQTDQFTKWLAKLDAKTSMRVHSRLHRASEQGNFGDHHGVGDGVSEMRLDFGPGYRVYYSTWTYRGHVLLLLLGGDKSTQNADIRRAKEMLGPAKARAEREMDRELEEQHGK